MSQIQVDNIYNKEATGSPNFPLGANVTGVVTATSFSGSGANLTGIDATALKDSNGTVRVQANTTGAVITGNVSVGGTLTYEDVTNVDAVGLITARSGIKVTGGDIDVTSGDIDVTSGNIKVGTATTIDNSGVNVTGVVTATSFEGSGASLTGIDAAPQIKVNASGSISAGNAVVANSDGTVSKIGLSYSAVDPYTVYGCPTEVYVNGNASPDTSDWLTCQIQDNYMLVGRKNESSSNTIQISWLNVPDSGDAATWSSVVSLASNGTLLDMHHDPTRNQAVVVYKQGDDKVYFRTVRVQSNNISTGSEHKLNDTVGYTEVKLSYDTVANKFLVVYAKDTTQSNYCTAQVMTVVDNDTFTFGSLVTILGNECAHIATDFDTSAGKHLVLYRDTADDDCHGIVATVSGTSVTFGTAVELETGNNEGAKIKYSTTDSKFLWLSLNMSGGEVDVSVLTISGTSVSRGTNTTITTNTAGNSSGTMAISYEPNIDVFYILYRNNYVGKKRTATISGTNVTVGSEANSRCGANSVADCDIAFESGSGRTLLVMQNGGTNKGIYQVWTTSSSTTNVTAENYIGVSDGNYTNGQEATIKLCGNTDNNQSGLTPGQNYFVQNNGTISLTADSPQVFVGNAVSATKLALASPAAPPTPAVEILATADLGSDYGQNYFDYTGITNTSGYIRYAVMFSGVQFVDGSSQTFGFRFYRGSTGALETGSIYECTTSKKEYGYNSITNESNSPGNAFVLLGNSSNSRQFWSGKLEWANVFNPSTKNAPPVARCLVDQGGNSWHSIGWDACRFTTTNTEWISGVRVFNYGSGSNLKNGRITVYGYRY